MLHRTAVTSSRGIDVRIENKVVFRLTMTRGGGGGGPGQRIRCRGFAGGWWDRSSAFGRK